jgi:glycosyltransferase involved in cell wall biosynthesis
MIQKKIIHKVKVAHNLLRDDGVLAVGIRGLEFIQKHVRSTNKHLHQGQIYTVARYEDVLNSSLITKSHKWTGIPGPSPKFAWIMPPPGKGSGGHLNIFRFIEFLESAGYECCVYLYVNGKHGEIGSVRTIMGDSYPNIKAAESMQWLEPGKELENIDGIFATSWETAYASYVLKSSAKRFYFVQDFEPYFYPVGGMSTLAENTYKMGFYGITAGGWLKKKLANDYQMESDYYNFGSDEKIYKYTNNGIRNEIFYYARPYTERRGFEVGILALDIFHRTHPEYAINIVGWDVSGYYIPFPYKNLKTLEINQLSDLYNRCVAGLVLSYTNMSLLPLELLGCGTIPVVNDGENNRLVSDNKYIAYSENSPSALARQLSIVVSRKNQQAYSKKASESVKGSGWQTSGNKFIKIVEREMKKP